MDVVLIPSFCLRALGLQWPLQLFLFSYLDVSNRGRESGFRKWIRCPRLSFYKASLRLSLAESLKTYLTMLT